MKNVSNRLQDIFSWYSEEKCKEKLDVTRKKRLQDEKKHHKESIEREEQLFKIKLKEKKSF